MSKTLIEKERLFKKLTPENWRQRDSVSEHIVRVEIDHISKISEDDWADIILKTELSDSVPEDIRDLFEVAQGAMCYGCFFYPLFTLGSQQLYRVLEAALIHKCAIMNAPKSIKTFAKMVSWLQVEGIISEKRFMQWDAGRHLRNSSSHAFSQNLYDQTMAVTELLIAEGLIEELFSSNSAPT